MLQHENDQGNNIESGKKRFQWQIYKCNLFEEESFNNLFMTQEERIDG